MYHIWHEYLNNEILILNIWLVVWQKKRPCEYRKRALNSSDVSGTCPLLLYIFYVALKYRFRFCFQETEEHELLLCEMFLLEGMFSGISPAPFHQLCSSLPVSLRCVRDYHSVLSVFAKYFVCLRCLSDCQMCKM